MPRKVKSSLKKVNGEYDHIVENYELQFADYKLLHLSGKMPDMDKQNLVCIYLSFVIFFLFVLCSFLFIYCVPLRPTFDRRPHG